MPHCGVHCFNLLTPVVEDAAIPNAELKKKFLKKVFYEKIIKQIRVDADQAWNKK